MAKERLAIVRVTVWAGLWSVFFISPSLFPWCHRSGHDVHAFEQSAAPPRFHPIFMLFTASVVVSNVCAGEWLAASVAAITHSNAWRRFFSRIKVSVTMQKVGEKQVSKQHFWFFAGLGMMQKKKSLQVVDLQRFAVPRAGVEPAQVALLVFETSASTDSAIWACLRCKGRSFLFYGQMFGHLFLRDAPSLV